MLTWHISSAASKPACWSTCSGRCCLHPALPLCRMQSNPAYLQTMAEQMSSMSPEQLAEALRQGGGAAAGVTPEMAKAAAEAMKGMPAEQLR